MVKEEAQEEWTPRIIVNSRGPANGHEHGTIRVIRPLRDIGMKECAIWAWWSGLTVVGRERSSAGKQSIGALTKGESSLLSKFALPTNSLFADFIAGLERDYPSTVSTIARTCAKLAPKKGTNGICVLCER